MTGARGYTTIEGRTLVLPSFLPGEKGEVEGLCVRKNHYEASCLERLDSSAMRIKPTCPYSGLCGGCDFDYVRESDSAALKSGIVKKNIEHSLKVSLDGRMEAPEYGSSAAYRCRCRIHVSMKDRKAGFLSASSSSLVEIRHCPMLTDRLNEVLENPRLIFTKAQSHLFSKSVNAKTGCIELSLFDCDTKVLFEKDEGMKTIGPWKYSVSADVFFQSNAVLMERMLWFVKEHASGERLMDLYSGVGTFSALFEGEGRSVTAVERDRNCLRLAKKNAPSARYFTDDVARWAASSDRKVDTVIVDPPRTGLGSAASMIASWNCDSVIYVSCNSASLAYDLKAFSSYEIEKVKVFDFYPGSGHEETVVILRHR